MSPNLNTPKNIIPKNDTSREALELMALDSDFMRWKEDSLRTFDHFYMTLMSKLQPSSVESENLNRLCAYLRIEVQLVGAGTGSQRKK